MMVSLCKCSDACDIDDVPVTRLVRLRQRAYVLCVTAQRGRHGNFVDGRTTVGLDRSH